MGGTGEKFTHATTLVAAVASLVATLMSIVSIWLQAKNYRRPLQQRYVVRILMMVPIYAISSCTSLVSRTAAAFVDPIRDIYEAFTIYTFFQLLINYLGGERALIVMMHGRAPVSHLWPLNLCLPKVDISDPHTFLAIKRGILQYAWLKPILALAAIIMKACGVYREGYISLNSGYLWTGLLYNVSVTLSLYSLGLFWVCMHDDLKPFRPVPKFLCVKLIIFASYWQGFFLSILVWAGFIPDQGQDSGGDHLAAAIQDALICLEMPIFAAFHWHAFSWRDFDNPNIQSARMTVGHAFRDAFGPRDLIEDSKMTFSGDSYGYRVFDSGDKIMAHEDSKSRLARLKDGMRYERGGKGKYWLPKPGVAGVAGAAAGAGITTPLLGSQGHAGPSSSSGPGPSLGPGPGTVTDRAGAHPPDHGTFDEEPCLDSDEESLYAKARELEFGDWNYPVITATVPAHERYASPRGSQLYTTPASPYSRAQQTGSPGSPFPSSGSGGGLTSHPQPSRHRFSSSPSSSESGRAETAGLAKPSRRPPRIIPPPAEPDDTVPAAAASAPAAESDGDDEEDSAETAPLFRTRHDEEAANEWDQR